MEKYNLKINMKDSTTLQAYIDLDHEPNKIPDKCLIGEYWTITNNGIQTLILCVDHISSILVTKA